MITETAIDKLIQPLLDRQTQIEMAIIQKIAKRVGEIKTMLPSDIFRLERLFKTGSDVREINKELARLTKLQQKDIKKIIKTVAGDAYADAKPYYDYRNKPFIPYEENEELQKAIQAVERVTLQDFDNLANATAFMMRDPARGNFLFPTSVSKTYQSVIDLAIQAATFNSASYNTLIPKAIKELVNSGLKTVEYNPESGKKYTVRLDTAVRRNILDGIRNVNQTVQNITGEQFGSDGKEISVHNMSAPDHEPIQGHQFTNEEIDNMQTGKVFVDVDGISFAPIDRPIGLWNCRHLMLNIIVGVFKPLYTKEQLEQIKENNANGYTYINSKGEKVTKSKYWCTQRMRDYELDIKKAKEGKEAAALAKEPDIEAQYQAKVTQKQNEYTQFCKACGLKPRYENTRIYTADNQIKSVDKIAESGIIESRLDERIGSPIEQRNTGKGNPNAILLFDRPLNARQIKLLATLEGYDSRVLVHKKSVNMRDLCALTAYTGDEFALFTKGKERLIIRGNVNSVNVDIEQAQQLSENGYKWSGHTHPGTDANCLIASPGDSLILKAFGQKRSSIYNSKGQYDVFQGG